MSHLALHPLKFRCVLRVYASPLRGSRKELFRWYLRALQDPLAEAESCGETNQAHSTPRPPPIKKSFTNNSKNRAYAPSYRAQEITRDSFLPAFPSPAGQRGISCGVLRSIISSHLQIHTRAVQSGLWAASHLRWISEGRRNLFGEQQSGSCGGSCFLSLLQFVWSRSCEENRTYLYLFIYFLFSPPLPPSLALCRDISVSREPRRCPLWSRSLYGHSHA